MCFSLKSVFISVSCLPLSCTPIILAWAHKFVWGGIKWVAWPSKEGRCVLVVGRDLSNNQLSGTIPASLGNLSNLENLCVPLLLCSPTVLLSGGHLSSSAKQQGSHSLLLTKPVGNFRPTLFTWRWIWTQIWKLRSRNVCIWFLYLTMTFLSIQLSVHVNAYFRIRAKFLVYLNKFILNKSQLHFRHNLINGNFNHFHYICTLQLFFTLKKSSKNRNLALIQKILLNPVCFHKLSITETLYNICQWE